MILFAWGHLLLRESHRQILAHFLLALPFERLLGLQFLGQPVITCTCVCALVETFEVKPLPGTSPHFSRVCEPQGATRGRQIARVRI